MNQTLHLEILPLQLTVCRLGPLEPIPAWALQGAFFSISKNSDELSIVCEQTQVPEAIQCERDWCCFKVAGPLDFALVGILARLARTLAEAKISLFAISTFDTDYILVKQKDQELAIASLGQAGHTLKRI